MSSGRDRGGDAGHAAAHDDEVEHPVLMAVFGGHRESAYMPDRSARFGSEPGTIRLVPNALCSAVSATRLLAIRTRTVAATLPSEPAQYKIGPASPGSSRCNSRSHLSRKTLVRM